MPIGAITVAIHMVLAAMTYVDFDAYHKYHDYSGIQGIVLLILKLVLFAYYIYCVCENMEKIPKKSKDFHRRLVLLGSLYLLTIPMTLIASFFFQPFDRQFFFTLMTNLSQLAANGLLL